MRSLRYEPSASVCALMVATPGLVGWSRMRPVVGEPSRAALGAAGAASPKTRDGGDFGGSTAGGGAGAITPPGTESALRVLPDAFEPASPCREEAYSALGAAAAAAAAASASRSAIFVPCRPSSAAEASRAASVCLEVMGAILIGCAPRFSASKMKCEQSAFTVAVELSQLVDATRVVAPSAWPSPSRRWPPRSPSPRSTT